MRGSSTLSFNIISFILGFFSGVLFWWIFSKIRGWFPRLRKVISQRAEEARQRSLAGIGLYIREETLKRAQRTHLGNGLFSLDEILIPPMVLASPIYIDPPTNPEEDDLRLNQALPYLPDWPELASQYSPRTISLAQALSNGANIAIFGQPGCGKTVALAHLASQISRQDSAIGDLIRCIPLFFHILDLSYNTSGDDDPLIPLIQLVSSRVPVLIARRIPSFLREESKKGEVVILVDGLDEMLSEEMQTAVAYLARLIKAYPKMRIVCATSSEYMDGLVSLGFFPVGLTSWNNRELEKFALNWGKLWLEKITPTVRKRVGDFSEPDVNILTNWLTNDPVYLTPLEWTIKIWSVYAGNLRGPSTSDALEAVLDCLLHPMNVRSFLEDLALEMVKSKKASLSYTAIESLYKGQASSNLKRSSSFAQEEENAGLQQPRKQRSIKGRQPSSSERTINNLLDSGILVEHANEQIRFTHSIFTGFLASNAINPDQAESFDNHENWAVRLNTLRFLVAQGKANSFIQKAVKEDTPPLHKNLLMVCRWLNGVPQEAVWRSNLFKHIVNTLHHERVPFGIRAKLVAALVCSNDPNLSLLFRQLLTSKLDTIRQLSALGCGAIRDTKSINDLLGLFSDPVDTVRIAACAAIAAMRDGHSLSLLSDILMQGDEESRRVVAEFLATDPTNGHPLLKEAIASPDLLTRRSAIYGLAQIREQWIVSVLEKITIEDGQWVVRNAAGQALESIKNLPAYLPRRLPDPDQAAWLITFASKHGVGVSPDHPVTDLLLEVLREGSFEERIAALQYLRQLPEEKVIKGIYEFISSEQGLMAEAGLYTLWIISCSGVFIPPIPPASFLS